MRTLARNPAGSIARTLGRNPALRATWLLILAPLLLLAPVWLSGQALFWGTPALQFVPWRWAAWEMLRAGHLPLWNPGVGMGAPLAANYQSALFYPPNWLQFGLAALGGVGWLAWGQALLVTLHLAWAAIGAARLARQAGLGELAQAVCGLAFGLSGYLVARAGFLSINAAIAWLPWVLVYVRALVDRLPSLPSGVDHGAPCPWRRLVPTVVKLGVVLAMQMLAGHAQTTWYTLLLAGLWAGWVGWGISGRTPRRHKAARMLGAWLGLALALVLAAALSAVQLLPTAEYLLQSQRSGSVGYEFAMTYSFWPWRFLTLFAPDLFGNPAHGDYQGYGNYWEDAVYIGLLPLLMAIGSAFSLVSGGTRKKPILFWTAIVGAAFCLALGNNTPLYPWLYRHVPSFALFQGPTRYSLWAELGLAMLAGYGVNAWRRPAGRGLYWTRLGTAGAFAVTLGAGLGWFFLGDIRPTFLKATALAGLWGLGAGVLSLLAPEASERARRGPGTWPVQPAAIRWSWVVALFVAADLLAAGWGLNPGTSLELYRQPAPAAATAGQGRLYIAAEDEYEIKFERFFSFKSFQAGEDWLPLRASRLPNLSLLDGLASVNNFDPLVPERYDRWMEALETATPAVQERLLNLMGVGMVMKVDDSQASGTRLSTRPQPRRLRWVPCAIAVTTPEEALSRVQAAAFDPQREVILETPVGDAPPACPGMAAAHPTNPVEPYILSEEPGQVTVRLQAEAAGWLVLSDVWYPGWRAAVDGRAADIRRADYLFRAVPIPAGDHRVTFSYRPVPFAVGALLSTAAWLVVLVCGWVGWRMTGGGRIRGFSRRDGLEERR